MVLALRSSKYAFIDIFKVTSYYCFKLLLIIIFMFFKKKIFTFYSQYAKLLRSYL